MTSEAAFLCLVVVNGLCVKESRLVNASLGKEEVPSVLRTNEIELLQAAFTILLHHKLIDVIALSNHKL